MSGFHKLSTTGNILLFIVLLTFVSYSPVLFNFFVGDDFVHLSWLAQAIHHPELVWRNFYTSWLDGTTTRFYRPLISVFMYTDYLLWGVNGLGFRLTNLAFHLASTIFIFHIVKFIQEKVDPDLEQTQLWPAFSAAIFALYPLHPEAVSWITGRVDSVVTTFCLAAFWFYLSWRQKQKIWLLAAALISMSLGLLSKEMAITLPVTFLFFEFVFCQPKNPLKLLQSIKPTLPFFVLLALYFLVRRLALGTFVGGYDNSLFFVANLKEFINGWLHGLKMLIEPINRSLLGSHSLITKAWEILLAISLSFGFLGFFISKKWRPALIFYSGWFVLCLLPVYKIFAIADDLQGSRLAYLATVPLAIIFGATFTLPKAKVATFARIAGSCFIALCAIVLWINNQPWQDAGKENNAIRSELKQLYAQIEGDPQVLFIGLPDQINGAYTCRNSLDGMCRRPQLDRDIKNSLAINPFEPIFPFGFLKDSIAQNKDLIQIIAWDSKNKKFNRVFIPQESVAEQIWQGQNLQSVLQPPHNYQDYKWNSDGSLSIKTGRTPCFLEFRPGANDCWTTNFISITLQIENTAKLASLDLLYTNELNQEFELRRRAHTECLADNSAQEAILALHGLPDWGLGGKYNKLRVLLPANSTVRISSIAIIKNEKVMPLLKFPNSGYLGSKGYLHLGAQEQSQTLSVDCSHIAGANSTELEITRANLLFEEQNCRKQSAVKMRLLQSPQTITDFTLNLKEFPMPGIYEVRAWAKDSTGKLCGVASDHIVISVD
ncbi:MAG: hypothetical protein K2W82_09005 [Candidatus Obscuribacterales bacterium]|nr:hypothetical protein [Candidatus Obscuribacterales bacterium]